MLTGYFRSLNCGIKIIPDSKNFDIAETLAELYINEYRSAYRVLIPDLYISVLHFHRLSSTRIHGDVFINH